jgi:phosphoenolpyruvate synthase/pyruvate phosphate dikinase
VSKSEFMRRLGEAGYGRESGRVGVLNLLARAGLPVPEGTVLTHRAHEEFLRVSGILRDIQAAAWKAGRRVAEMRRKHASSPVEGELNQAICEVLIELNAKSAVVLSGDFEKGSLSSIPEVRDAVRKAWLSPPGLERQIAAIARGGDLPTWPVLV